ncbi:MAG: TRL domain-containing protein [Candidatus Margulisiibacteriota bacterium]
MIKKSLFALICVTFLSASLSAAPLGLLYSSTTEPVTATAKVGYSKQVEVSTSALLWLFGFGDASLETAMKKAGITQVHHIDKTTTVWPLGTYIQETYTVYGD